MKKLHLIFLLITLSPLVVCPDSTSAATLTTLYSFLGGADGGQPQAALVQGTDSNLYGTTFAGG